MARNHSLKTFVCILLSSFYDRSIISIFSFVSKSSSSSFSSVQFSHPTASLQTKMSAFKLVVTALQQGCLGCLVNPTVNSSLIELKFGRVKLVVTALQQGCLGCLVNPTVNSSLIELKFGRVREDTERRQSWKWISTGRRRNDGEMAKEVWRRGRSSGVTTASTSEMRRKTRRWLRKKTRRSSGSDKAEDR
uniref:Uncharacterized protein n=1 Tax=Brassica oleracea var. oleracea TaxID=109376 RepID=A0A0D3AXF5_BRAOL